VQNLSGRQSSLDPNASLVIVRFAARLFGATLPMTWPQKLICTPQAYEETCSQREKPQQDGEPKNDGILAPAYLDAVSIGQFA
jgi:hypothetical protein